MQATTSTSALRRTTPRVLNVGSLNIDHVYAVPHLVRFGETLASDRYTRGAGGKGFNQSIALARAGVKVAHAGCIGPEGHWLRERLAAEGIDVSCVREVPQPTGHAIIQVDAAGQNAIVIFAGANHALQAAHLPAMLEGFGRGDWLVCQNETSVVAELIAQAHERGLTICANPAPMTDRVRGWPLDLIDWIVLNETEASGLTGETEPLRSLVALERKLPRAGIIVTLGAAGVIASWKGERLEVPAPRVTAVDMTAAGDTFLGYMVGTLFEGAPLRRALVRACAAAALSVTRHGAADSIPNRDEVDRLR
jgi:ribokinase